MILPHLLAEYTDRVRAEIDAEAKRLAGGNAADWPDYRHRAGRVAGLELALTTLETIMKETDR